MSSVPERYPSLIHKAVKILNEGGLVAFPTETVYGLGADASNEAAVRKIFQVKKRPHHHPLIVHLSTMEDLPKWAIDIPEAALKLGQAFWPGPLTLVLKKHAHVLNVVTAQQQTIGLRIPKHAIAQDLLKTFGGGVAAPSANRFTHISPTTAQAVYEELGSKIDLILEGGACQVGLESTIIDMTHEPPVILRPGMITAEAINRILGLNVIYRHKMTQRVPGMHAVHYAPTTQTRLVQTDEMISILQNLKSTDLPIAFLVRSPIVFPHSKQIIKIQMANDATRFAHHLYHTLRTLDHQQLQSILIEAVPEDPEWDGIRDRIFKSTASRNEAS